MSLPNRLDQLQPYDMDRAIIEETAAQLIKDFGEFSLSVEFKGVHPSPYEELFVQVLPYVEMLIRNNQSMLSALLYRIDVPEATVKKVSRERPGVPFPELVTDLILRRELQKVLTRRYFSKKQ